MDDGSDVDSDLESRQDDVSAVHSDHDEPSTSSSFSSTESCWLVSRTLLHIAI